MKKIIFIIILFLSCYIIYNLTYEDKFNYLTIGDSLSLGVNNYGIKQYGYSDYVRDYLKNNNILKKYDNTFTDPNYRVTDLLRMIEYNEIKTVNGKDISFNRLINNADIITLSIGMNELYYKLKMNDSNVYSYMNGLLDDLELLLKRINRFNHKKVFVLGYYNVINCQDEINYINTKLKHIVEAEGFEYIDLSNIFDNNPKFFDKNDSFIPNNDGYFKISQIIVEKIIKY